MDYDKEDDPDEWASKTEIDDEDRTLATRAFSLSCQGEHQLLTPYQVLRDAWNETRRNWEQSPAHGELLETLATVRCPPNADKIVCFGLGSLDGCDGYPTLDEMCDTDGLPLRTSMTQHCAALTLAATLGAQIGKPPLKILAQDPAYAPNQVTLLAEEGIEVVPGIGALGFTYVDEDAIVFSCHPDVPVKQIVADVAKPAGMIWDAVKPADREATGWELREAFGTHMICSPWCTDEDSVRTRALVAEYDKADFPPDRQRFGRLEMYFRKEQ